MLGRLRINVEDSADFASIRWPSKQKISAQLLNQQDHVADMLNRAVEQLLSRVIRTTGRAF